MKQQIPVNRKRTTQRIHTKVEFSTLTIVSTSFLQLGQIILQEYLGTVLETTALALNYIL